MFFRSPHSKVKVSDATLDFLRSPHSKVKVSNATLDTRRGNAGSRRKTRLFYLLLFAIFSFTAIKLSFNGLSSARLWEYAYTGSDAASSTIAKDKPQHSRFVYAFLISGCDPAENNYRGFLYNVLVATTILSEEGSTADVVVYIQMKQSSSVDQLPEYDVNALEALSIQVIYIPKARVDSFYSTVLEKLRVLSLTDYDRVLFLDGDVMPIGNLDYLFDLSQTGVLKENVISSASANDPCNAGFFMLKPEVGGWEKVLEIVRQRELSLKNATHLNIRWDEVQGWGHPILPPDSWIGKGGQPSYNWTFSFAYSDQGLLYYYTKYIKRNFSIMYGDTRVENWVDNGENFSAPLLVELEATINTPFANYSRPRIKDGPACRWWKCDYAHFAGTTKPWLTGPPKDLQNATETNAEYMWWLTLQKLNSQLSLGLNFTHWAVIGPPPVGFWAVRGPMNERVNHVTRRRR
jgi:hypothetical protein